MVRACPYDSAEWTSELQGEMVNGCKAKVDWNSLCRVAPVTEPRYDPEMGVPEMSEAGFHPCASYRDFFKPMA
jgi:hypothetical protein